MTYFKISNDEGQKYIINRKRDDCDFSINRIKRWPLYQLKVQLCIMELLNFIFRLGVLFAIYGFLWGIFEIGITLLRSGRPKTVFEEYFIKSVKYLFLVDVTFLFCTSSESTSIRIIVKRTCNQFFSSTIATCNQHPSIRRCDLFNHLLNTLNTFCFSNNRTSFETFNRCF